MFNKTLFKQNFHNVITSQKELNWLMLWGLLSFLCGVFDVPFIPTFIGLTILVQLFFMGTRSEVRFSKLQLEPSYFNLMALYHALWVSFVITLIVVGGMVIYGVNYA